MAFQSHLCEAGQPYDAANGGSSIGPGRVLFQSHLCEAGQPYSSGNTFFRQGSFRCVSVAPLRSRPAIPIRYGHPDGRLRRFSRTSAKPASHTVPGARASAIRHRCRFSRTSAKPASHTAPVTSISPLAVVRFSRTSAKPASHTATASITLGLTGLGPPAIMPFGLWDLTPNARTYRKPTRIPWTKPQARALPNRLNRTPETVYALLSPSPTRYLSEPNRRFAESFGGFLASD